MQEPEKYNPILIIVKLLLFTLIQKLLGNSRCTVYSVGVILGIFTMKHMQKNPILFLK